MNGSFHDVLKPVEKLVISAGHGAGDPGACNGPHREAEQVIVMVREIACILRPLLPPGAVVTVPFALGLKPSVAWINNQFSAHGTAGRPRAWCIEIHRDSSMVTEPVASWRCGLYRSTNKDSVMVADAVCAEMIAAGAHASSWVRSHQDRGGLHWITGIRALSHILELGFMEGRNDHSHLMALSRIAAAGIFKAFTGARLKGAEVEKLKAEKLKS